MAQDAQSVRLVLGLGRIAQRLHRGHDGRLIRVTLASQAPLPGADRHTGVGNAVVLAPGRQRGDQTAIDVRRINAAMCSDFLEIDGLQRFSRGLDLGEPLAEAQVAGCSNVRLWL